MQTSAGVLIYTRDSQNQKRFLLGRDSKYKCWSDFGGKYEYADSSPIETAAREFYEETAGIIMSKYHIASMIEKLNTKILKCSSYKNRSYVMFLVDVTEFIPTSPHFIQIKQRFQRFAALITAIRNEECLYRFKEKNEIGLFTSKDIVKNPGTFRSVFYNSFLNNLDTINDA